MATVTKPILLDETGQAIVTALGAIENAIEPRPVVLYTEQQLTEAQKQRARANIGAQAFNPGAIDFAAMQQAVQNGNGPEMFPVGSIFYVPHSGIIDGVIVNVPFEVVAHDHYAITGKAHTMTVMSYYGLKSFAFCQKMGFYNTGETGLAAGAYSWKYNTTTLYFNLTSALGAHRLLFRDNNTKATIYNTDTWATEGTITMQTASISGATSLGNSGDTDYVINHHQRSDSGSPNYGQSFIRQWMNSDGAPNTIWFSQKTPWDNFSGITMGGFLYGMNPDFLSIVGTTDIITQTLAYEYPYQLPDKTTVVYPTNDQYTCSDKFFPLSRREAGLDAVSVEGTVLDKYADAVAADRIKSLISNASNPQNWWLRSPNTTDSAYSVTSSGVSGTSGARSSYAFVPACNIC